MKIYSYLFCFLILSCNSQEERENFKKIDIFKCSKDALSFTKYNYVKLETGQDHLIGSNILIKFYKSDIYVMDTRNEKCVMHFDKTGIFLNKIGKVGYGPEEYSNILDFAIDNDTISILSGQGAKSKIYNYLVDGSYIKDFIIDVTANSIEKTPSGFLLNTSFSPKQYRFYSIDRDGNIIDSFLRNNMKFVLPILDHNFLLGNSEIYFTEAFNNSVYSFKDGIFQKKYELNFENYNIPKEFFEKELVEGFTILNNAGFAIIRKYVENNRFALFEITIQKEGDPEIIYQIVYDKVSINCYKKVFKNTDYIQYPLKYLITMTENNELVYLVYPSDIISNPTKYEFLFTENSLESLRLNEIDNPIIVFCKFNYEK